MSEGGCDGRETLYVVFRASEGVVVGGKPSTSRYERARGLWWAGNPLRRVLSEREGCGGSERVVVGGKPSASRFERA